MQRFIAFVAGTMCGAIVGTVASLFLAPSSGKEIRDEAQRRLNQIVEEGRHAADRRRGELETQLRQMQQREQA
ncbi:MAG TPA: YtxH domain-containing protein [Anaerolineae bacterium]|nr:YtxH domain-containing protein [Anaerolineae bacterium]